LAMALLAFLVPGLRQVLGIVPLHIGDWLLVLGVALGLLTVVEVGKALTNRRHRSASLRMSHSSHKTSRGV
jgi:hypothetical protein